MTPTITPTTMGGTQSFTTGNPAVIRILKASSITASGGVLNATIDPVGAHGNAGFEWGTDLRWEPTRQRVRMDIWVTVLR